MVIKATGKPRPTTDKDVQQLNLVIAALKGSQHNPVDWAAIIRLVAPIIGRMAARYAASFLAGKWNKRASPKIRKEVADSVADRLTSVVFKSLLK